MHPIRVFITPFSAALIGTVLMAAPAPAAPGSNAPEPTLATETATRLDDRLERAHRAVAAVEARLAGLDGVPLPPSAAADLRAAVRAVDEARALAGPRGAMGPALARVREGLTRAAGSPRVTSRTAALLGDAALTLGELSINSALLNALGHLAGAAEALEAADRAKAASALDRAEAAIEAASARGGPHVAGDLEAVRRARRTLFEAAPGGPGALNLAAGMAEVRSHLLDVEVPPH